MGRMSPQRGTPSSHKQLQKLCHEYELARSEYIPLEDFLVPEQGLDEQEFKLAKLKGNIYRRQTRSSPSPLYVHSSQRISATRIRTEQIRGDEPRDPPLSRELFVENGER
jgi:hypothetical protein